MIDSDSRAENEFRNWASGLKAEELSEHERKLLNILLSNFSALAHLGTAKGLRAKKLRELIDSNRKTVSIDFDAVLKKPIGQAVTLKKVSRLDISGPFRGFAAADQFVFEKDYTIAYGPNGTGKSSFFEAIEYALLGEIEEADAKRIKVDNYIQNDISKQSSRPIVIGLDNNDKEFQIPLSPMEYRFCFLEKNRIEKFARISATTEQEQTARIAALFGLDSFNRFVNDFTERFAQIGEIDLLGEKNLELKLRQESVRNHQSVIDAFAEKEAAFTKAEQQITATVAWDKTFSELETFLHGSIDDGKEKQKGRLELLDEELLQSAKPELALISETHLNQLFEQFSLAWRKYYETRTRIQERKQEVNFRRLYESLLEVEIFRSDICPACRTPVDRVVQNPFEHAKTELQNLADVAKLEEELESNWLAFAGTSQAFGDAIRNLNGPFEKMGMADRFVWPQELAAPAVSFSNSLESGLRGVLDRWPQFAANTQTLRSKVDAYNRQQKEIADKRQGLEKEREKWRPVAAQIKELIGREKSAREEKAQAEAALQKFHEGQKDLIEAAKAEIPIVEENKLYVSAYDSLIGKLRVYRDSLPGKLVKGVSEEAVRLYNEINDHDEEFEKLVELSLPSVTGEIVSIRFKGEADGVNHSALTILSEGHIRCLGLAILLAKNVQQNCPLLVFDDIVNAIDDDHRHGIARLLISDPLFKNRQMILLSHGEEFTKLLETSFPAQEARAKVGRIDFLPPQNKLGIRVNHTASSRNYVVRARDHLTLNEIREALAACRRALENTCIELWRQLERSKYDALIFVGMRSYTSRPELRTMMDSLKKFLNTKVTPPTAENIQLSGCFDTFAQNWSYFNRGTHDEPELSEFDPVIVKKFVGDIETADGIVKGKTWLS